MQKQLLGRNSSRGFTEFTPPLVDDFFRKNKGGGRLKGGGKLGETPWFRYSVMVKGCQDELFRKCQQKLFQKHWSFFFVQTFGSTLINPYQNCFCWKKFLNQKAFKKINLTKKLTPARFTFKVNSMFWCKFEFFFGNLAESLIPVVRKYVSAIENKNLSTCNLCRVLRWNQFELD